MSTKISRRERTYVLVVLALALALRLLYSFEMRGHMLVQHLQLDEQFHERWAQAIAAGDVVGKGVFFRAPLYPYLLAVVYAVFDNATHVVRILQHVFGVVAVLLVYLLSRSLFGVRAAVIASLLAALYAVLIYFEGRLLFDFPVTFLALLWLTLATMARETLRWQRFALLGFLFGLICTMRPVFLPLAVPLLGSLLWRDVKGKGERLRSGSIFVLAFLLPVGAVTLRNAIVGGDAVVIASQGGINFYIGNNPLADGMTPSVPELGGVIWENRQAEFVAEKAYGRPVRPSEVSAYWYARAWQFMRDDPLAFVKLLLKKLYLFWSHIEIKNNLSFYSFERASSVLSLLPVGFWIVGPLGIAGAVLAWKGHRGSRLLSLFIVTYCLVIVAFFVCDRFRLPVVPVLCVFAGYAVHQATEALRGRDRKLLLRCAVLFASGALFVNTNFVQLRPDIDFGEEEVQARAALEGGNYAQAAQLFDYIATSNPQNFAARVNHGIALWKMGKMQEAIAALRAGIGADPYPAVLNLAHLFFTLHQIDSSYAYAQHAIAARPFAPGGYVIAARCLAAHQQATKAEEMLLKGREACGEDFIYGEYLLAGLYFQQGKLSPADSVYRAVLRRTARTHQPSYMIESERGRYGEDLSTIHAKSLHALGIIFGILGRLDSSEAYLRRAALQLPDKADVWGDWGVCLLRLKRLEEADTVMQRSLSLKPENPALWFNYGTLLAHQGKLLPAREAVARSLSMKPDFPEAQRLIMILDAQLAQLQRKK